MSDRSPPQTPPGRWARAGRPTRALVGAVAAAALAATAVGALRTPGGQGLDTAVFARLALADAPLEPVRDALAALALLGAVAALLAALVRRRGGTIVVLAAAAGPAVTYALAVLLRDHVLTRPDLGAGAYPHNTFPSGHTALVCALAVTIVMLAGRPNRTLLVSLATLVLVTAWVNVASMAHRPSDVVAGVLLGLAVGAGIDAATRPGAPRPGPRAEPVRR